MSDKKILGLEATTSEITANVSKVKKYIYDLIKGHNVYRRGDGTLIHFIMGDTSNNLINTLGSFTATDVTVDNITVNSTITVDGYGSDDWNTAYALRLQWGGGNVNLDVTAARNNLGLGTTQTPTFGGINIDGDGYGDGNFTISGDVDIGGSLNVADVLKVNIFDPYVDAEVIIDGDVNIYNILTVGDSIFCDGAEISGREAGTTDLGSTSRRYANLYIASNIDYTSALKFNCSSATKVTITTAGYVGIGTTDPHDLLELYGDTQTVSAILTNTFAGDCRTAIYFRPDGGTTNKAEIYRYNDAHDATPGELHINNKGDYPIIFKTNAIQRLKVADGYGNIEIDDGAGNGGGWDTGHLVLGNYHFWVDANGDLRSKDGAPGTDLDGALVASQTE